MKQTGREIALFEPVCGLLVLASEKQGAALSFERGLMPKEKARLTFNRGSSYLLGRGSRVQ
jgi:hypothetical protein